MSRKPRRGEAHVRLYRHELECPAYRSLSPDARALLVEFRALFNGGRNAIHMSVREAQRRVGIGRWKAENAIHELLERGFILVLEPGGFQRKSHHATVYALTNEPLDGRDGAVAPRDYMRWAEKSSVLVTSTVGVGDQHRKADVAPSNGPHGVSGQHRNPPELTPHGVSGQHTDKLPGGLMHAALCCQGETQLKVIVAALCGPLLERAAA